MSAGSHSLLERSWDRWNLPAYLFTAASILAGHVSRTWQSLDFPHQRYKIPHLPYQILSPLLSSLFFSLISQIFIMVYFIYIYIYLYSVYPTTEPILLEDIYQEARWRKDDIETGTYLWMESLKSKRPAFLILGRLIPFARNHVSNAQSLFIVCSHTQNLLIRGLRQKFAFRGGSPSEDWDFIAVFICGGFTCIVLYWPNGFVRTDSCKDPQPRADILGPQTKAISNRLGHKRET